MNSSFQFLWVLHLGVELLSHMVVAYCFHCKTSLAKNVLPFDEIKKVLDSAQKLIDLLEKIAPDINSDKVVNPKAFLKIIKPLCVSVENSLPILMEFEDNLLYLKDDNAYVLRQKISHIEDDLLPPILAYIKEHEKD